MEGERTLGTSEDSLALAPRHYLSAVSNASLKTRRGFRTAADCVYQRVRLRGFPPGAAAMASLKPFLKLCQRSLYSFIGSWSGCAILFIGTFVTISLTFLPPISPCEAM
jgi:hypothetical protein